MDPNVILSKEPDEDENDNGDKRGSTAFAETIGKLSYAALCTRPDISYAVNTLAQFSSRPYPIHWTAIKRVFAYLKGTRTYGIIYKGGTDQSDEPQTYTDADWGSNLHRKSVSGYIVILSGGAVAWSSKKQSTVALSTAEAEYIAATHATKQILWQRYLFKELDLPHDDTSILLSDNQAAIAISHNPGFHARTKHIDIALHFLSDHVANGTITLKHVQSRDNLADLFTKSLNKVLHQDLTFRIGVMPKQGGVLEN